VAAHPGEPEPPASSAAVVSKAGITATAPRRGKKRAVVALMHALLLISYHVLRRRLAWGNSVPTALRDATAPCASPLTAGDCANWAWLLCVSSAAGPDDGDVCAAPVPFRAVQEGRDLEIFGNNGTCSS